MAIPEGGDRGNGENPADGIRYLFSWKGLPEDAFLQGNCN